MEVFSPITSRLNFEKQTSLSLIQDYAFKDCVSLKKINLPTGVNQSASFNSPFNNTGLTEITVIEGSTHDLGKLLGKTFSGWINGEQTVVEVSDSYFAA